MNISAQDLDKDDVLELGYAFVLSTAKDFIQAGYGYNFGVDACFWFVGIRLPIGGTIFGGAETVAR